MWTLITKNNRHFGVYHFSDNKAMTWYDFAEQILLENKMSNKINLVKVNNYPIFAR